MARRLTAALLLTGLLLALTAQVPVDEQLLQEQTWAIAGKLACPVCAGQSVKDSGAELAVQMRAAIAEQLRRGRSETEVIAFMVDRYGEEILLDPPKSGPQLWVWMGPVAIVAGGLAVAASRFEFFRFGRRRPK
jgi:cytochrome c-type biogenesis protein CcmH